MKPKPFVTLAAACLLVGCAHFTTKQTDERTAPDGENTKITTRATAYTFWESKSALANFRASQTEKTQGASVGTLNQESGGTNTAAVISALAELLKAVGNP